MGDGELHLRHHGLQLVERNHERFGRRHRRQRRIILGRQSEEAEFRGARLDEHRVVFLHHDANIFVRQRADDVEKPLRFDGHSAGRRDFRCARAEDRYIEVRCRDLQTAVGSFEQHVRKNWNRRSLLHHALAKLQFFLKINFGDSQLHVSSLRNRVSLVCSGGSGTVRKIFDSPAKDSKV